MIAVRSRTSVRSRADDVSMVNVYWVVVCVIRDGRVWHVTELRSCHVREHVILTDNVISDIVYVI